MSTECIFCKIVARDIPTHIIYEDDTTLAFLDSNPVNHGHTLVIPKEHHTTIHDTPEQILEPLIRAVKKLSSAVKQGVDATGINIHMNNEADAGQVIPHIHFHIIPRFKGDGIEMWEQHPYPEGAARAVQEKIRARL